MAFRLVDTNWSKELQDAIQLDGSSLRIISPFIKEKTLDRFLQNGASNIQVVTRFNLNDFAAGVSDISALRLLLQRGARVRGIKDLHAKAYIFGDRRAIVTSANLTEGGLIRNHEFGVVSDDRGFVEVCSSYFDDLWNHGRRDLVAPELDQWDEELQRCLAGGGRYRSLAELRDFGAESPLEGGASVSLPARVAGADQSFVKFFGTATNRLLLHNAIEAEIERGGWHWALTYPVGRRPRSVKDGALMFYGRLVSNPADTRIVGRAIALSHVPGRDEATLEDIRNRAFKANYPNYIRVHHAEFVAGTFANGVSLGEMMDELGAGAFASTARNLAAGAGNTNPRKALRRQASVELAPEGRDWLSQRLELAFEEHGRVPTDFLEELDWPEVPSS